MRKYLKCEFLISFCRVKSVMNHLEGHHEFPRLCIGQWPSLK
uniref:Uncharacterized protein n=1 Tax=Rhizophora mucronata TaxID=61149 RepID=A0A2P2L5N2_RHIMU